MQQFFRYVDGLLHCESLSLAELSKQYGSPLYVYSKKAIVENCRAIEAAFGGQPHLTTYAVKACSNLHVLRCIAEQGLGADVGSKGELFLALKAGFPPEKISLSGVGKRDDEIEYALEQNILALNVESEQEIEVIQSIARRMDRRARILLRLNLDIDAGTHAYISTSKKQNKFGVGSGRAVQVLKRAQQFSHIEIRGIHSHIGSQITNLGAFVSAAEALARVVNTLRKSGIPVHDLDFGGGYGVQYHGVVNHPNIPDDEPENGTVMTAEFIEAVLPILLQTGCNLAIQPGRSVVAQAGVLVTNVLYRKEEEKTFIIVDAGMNDLIRPSLYQAYHQIVPVVASKRPFEQVDVVGPCCESGDFFAQDRTLPRMERADALAVLCAGAYGFVLSSNYNARLRPAEVLVDGEASTLIRERETLEDVLH